jgi:hypothetical protein
MGHEDGNTLDSRAVAIHEEKQRKRIRELERALHEAREEVARRDEAINMTCDGCTAIGDDGECYHPKWDHCPLYPFKANQAERDG